MSIRSGGPALNLPTLGLLVVLPCSFLFADPPVRAGKPGDAQIGILRLRNVSPNEASVSHFLRSLSPSSGIQRRLPQLIRQMGDTKFAVRERAMDELELIGRFAKSSLREAGNSRDREVAYRAKVALKRIERGENSGVRDAVALAALRLAKLRQWSSLVPDILEILPFLEGERLRDEAKETLWAIVRASDSSRLQQAVRQSNPVLRGAAIPAWERIRGRKIVAEVRPMLNDANRDVRLSAARALLDHMPLPSIRVLIAELQSDHANRSLRAAWLLHQLTGGTARNFDLAAVRKRWQQGLTGTINVAGLRLPLGTRRYQLSPAGIFLHEAFTRDVAEIRSQYGAFEYKSDIAGKAAVINGVLHLDGKHAEGTQRLVLKSQRMLGRAEFPRRFRVHAKIGGETENAGGWHTGIAIGNVRVLFHPGLAGGAFRSERVDDHRFLSGNLSMPFTPAAGKLHDITVDVTQTEDKPVVLRVLIKDASGSGKSFRANVHVSRTEIGKIDSVSLDRSGRSGGAALFGEVTIDTTHR